MERLQRCRSAAIYFLFAAAVAAFEAAAGAGVVGIIAGLFGLSVISFVELQVRQYLLGRRGGDE